MRRLRALFLRIGGLFGHDRRERELADEIASHLALNIEENLSRGMTREEARRRALIRLGGVEMTKEIYREQRGLPVIETLVQDLRFAMRMLWKNRAFTVVAVLVMALGIGANTAVFSVVNAVLLRPLAFNDPDRLVNLSSLWLKDGHHGAVSMPDFKDWHDQSSAFEAMTNYKGYEIPVSVSSSAEYVFHNQSRAGILSRISHRTDHWPRVHIGRSKTGRNWRGNSQQFIRGEPLWQRHRRIRAHPATFRQDARYRRRNAPRISLPRQDRYLVSGLQFHAPDCNAWRPQRPRLGPAERWRHPRASPGANDRDRRTTV